MALKDLVADHKKLTEEMIERMVAAHVRYDPTARKIIWTPEARSLGNDAKILVYLVAVPGWQYVLDEAWDAPTKPSDLEDELGISGGTLRPILKKLKDSHLLAVENGHYRAQFANLDSIEAVIAGEKPKSAPKSRARRPSKAESETTGEPESDLEGGARKRNRIRGATGQLKTLLTKWAGDGFFNEPKTLADLLERYHENGVIAKQTSLSGLMLDAVRQGVLARIKNKVGGRQVWTYRIGKA